MSYRFDKVKADVRLAATKLAQRRGMYELLLKQKNEATVRHMEAVRKLGQLDLVQILLEKTSSYAKQQQKARLEEIVTNALRVVFGKPYNFEIELDTQGGTPITKFWLECFGVRTQLKPPDYDRGGGEVDVVSLALFLGIGELMQVPGPRFLDEVGKHVSAGYAQNVAYFLKEYSRQFDRQIILITHNKHLAEIGDLSLHVTQENGESRVQII